MIEGRFDPVWRRILEMSRANNDSGYGELVADWPLSYYRERLRQIEFQGFDHVLDVGCGHGHWLSALATLNRRVSGVDIHEKRVETTKALLQDLWLDNAEARIGSAVGLPFPNESFDALFCYGVFMFLDQDKALKEFARVLKPGGSLYVCTNGRGWWLKLALERFFSNRTLAKLSLRAFLSGRRKGIPTATDLQDVPVLLARNGFLEPRASGEGQLTADGAPTLLKPHYDAKYRGFDCVIEFMAKKPGPISSPVLHRLPFEPALRHVEQAAGSTHYSYTRDFARFMTEDTDDTTFATNPAAASLSRVCADGADRAAFLRNAAEISAGGRFAPEERIRAHVTLTQKLFYHHFAVQPWDGVRHMVDPIEVAAFRACRCGNSARFLVDLLEIDGLEARLIAGACHTAAEVRFAGEWRLLDASLYPPGVILIDDRGDLLSTERVLANPELLDAPASYVNLHSGHIAMWAEHYPRIFSKIERYMRCSILPSVGYFGAALAGPARAGTIERYRKSPISPATGGWRSWHSLETLDRSPAPALPVIQRPEQVPSVTRSGGRLFWVPARTYAGEAVTYDVYLLRESRGWSYDSIPVGHDLSLPGTPITTSACAVDLPAELAVTPLYVSIVSRLSDRPHVFCLPSDEFLTGAVCE